MNSSQRQVYVRLSPSTKDLSDRYLVFQHSQYRYECKKLYPPTSENFNVDDILDLSDTDLAHEFVFTPPLISITLPPPVFWKQGETLAVSPIVDNLALSPAHIFWVVDVVTPATLNVTNDNTNFLSVTLPFGLHVVVFRCDQANSYIKLNGVEKSSGTIGANNSLTIAGGDDEWYLMEMLVFDTIRSDENELYQKLKTAWYI